MKINFMEILKGVGSAVLKEVPGGSLAIAALNAVLPADKKLSDTATVEEAKQKYDSLSSADQAAIKMKEFDVKIAEINSWAAIQESFSKADISGNSTRPDIAMMLAKLVVFVDGLMALLIAWAVIDEQIDISTAWPMVLALITPPLGIVGSYFGKRNKEKIARYGAIMGQDITGTISSISNIFKRK